MAERPLRAGIWRRTPLDWTLLAFLLATALAWTSARSLDGATLFTGRILLGAAIVLTLPRLLPDARCLAPVLWLLSLALPALDAIVLLKTDWPAAKLLPLAALYARLPHWPGETIHPNVAAAALLLLLPFPAALLARPADRAAAGGAVWGRAGRLICAAILGLSLAVLFLTQSRAAWLAVGLMLLAGIGARLPDLRWRLVVAGIVGLAAALVWWRLSGRLTAGWLDRQLVWTQALTMLQDFGLTGSGPGGFAAVGAALYPDFHMGGAGFVAPHAHNLLLQVGVDTGIGGLIAYLGLLLAATANAWRARRRARLPLTRAAGAAVVLSLLGLFVDGLLDVGVWNTQPALVAWTVLGLAAAFQADW